MGPDERGEAAVEALRERVPDAELYQAHPALPLLRCEGDEPDAHPLEELPPAWLTREPEDRRRAHEAFRRGEKSRRRQRRGRGLSSRP